MILVINFLALTIKIDIAISNATNIPILTILLPTSIAAASESIKICAITQGHTPLEYSFIVPNINVFPNIIR